MHFLKNHREWSQIAPAPPPPPSIFRLNNRPASLLKQETVTSFKVIKISWRSFSIWQLKTLLQSEFDMSEVYPEPCQISKIKRFAKIVNGISSVIILQNATSLIIDRILNTLFKYGSLILKMTFFVHFHDMFLFKTMIKQSTLLSMCGIDERMCASAYALQIRASWTRIIHFNPNQVSCKLVHGGEIKTSPKP